MSRDMFYCMSCRKTFKDTWRRANYCADKEKKRRLQTNCPFCMCMHTVNADKIIKRKRYINLRRGFSDEFVEMLVKLKEDEKK